MQISVSVSKEIRSFFGVPKSISLLILVFKAVAKALYLYTELEP